ncbi:hypothetical protein ABPG74_009649 [Tetrahymena malaccensis]
MNMYQQEISEQDKHIDEINYVVDKLKDQQHLMKDGLDEMGQKLSDLEEGIDKNGVRMNAVQKKLSKLLQTNDTSQICTILILFGILCALIFLVIYT